MAYPLTDETGNEHGYLTVKKRVENNSEGKAQWECECVCGKTRVVAGAYLRLDRTISCGYMNRKGGEDV